LAVGGPTPPTIGGKMLEGGKSPGGKNGGGGIR